MQSDTASPGQPERERRPVLLLVEFQRQWTDAGLYRRLLEPDLTRRDVVASTVALAEHARSCGVPIIHAPLVIDPHALHGRFAKLTRGLVFTRGKATSELTPDIYRVGDLIARGRTAFDAFTDSDLQEQLTALNASAVLIAGFTTDQCVSKTLRTARRMGFDANIVIDCTATYSRRRQRRTEAKLGPQGLPLASAREMFAAHARA
ncbi:nicotinamidase-related amidase [Jatrophihabitans sp. GAS493]|uniref:isochorismatase family cysteine hydrolase n=1 Tax=Jatrophihabitans sp. GAS493 TaxID=1907575 RepID=UPI000BBFC5F6|nr:isochorismatase family cysteine hydrolase [Jatrophihabitans sp. GAS493]SOD71755.1 nicotinamidase-related amidase [Jatrophihabitans sp. GAS493]